MNLVLWRHWNHVTQVQAVTSQYQFHCAKLYSSVTHVQQQRIEKDKVRLRRRKKRKEK